MNTLTGFQDALARLGLSGYRPTGNNHPANTQSMPYAAEQGVRAQAAAVGVAREATALAYGETFQLSITTREGDQVQVDVRQMLAAVHASERRFAAAAGPQGVAVVASREQLSSGQFEARFGLHVRGELNEDEMLALKSIFEQVARLADEFFGGNIPAALEAARALQVDGSEIGHVSLDMTQQFTYAQVQQQAVAAYVEVERTGPQDGPWPPRRAAQQVSQYWAQVEQVRQTIQTTFRSFSLAIETLMGGGDRRTVSAIEEVHEQIEQQVGQLRALLGLTEQPQAADEAVAEETAETAEDAAVEAKQHDAPARAAAHTGESGEATASEEPSADVPREQKVDVVA